MTEQKEIATRPTPAPKSIAMGASGLALTSLEDAYRFAQYVVKSRLAPKDDTAEAVLVKFQTGAELGLPPMRALSVIAVINGRPQLMGEAVLALCRASGKFAEIRVGNEGEGDNRFAFVKFVRSDTGETGEVRFSIADAKRAGLMVKDTYKGYPDDMTLWKAVGRFGKRYASDVCMGIDVSETAPDNRPMLVKPNDTPRELPPADETEDPIFEEAQETADEVAHHGDA